MAGCRNCQLVLKSTYISRRCGSRCSLPARLDSKGRGSVQISAELPLICATGRRFGNSNGTEVPAPDRLDSTRCCFSSRRFPISQSLDCGSKKSLAPYRSAWISHPQTAQVTFQSIAGFLAYGCQGPQTSGLFLSIRTCVDRCPGGRRSCETYTNNSSALYSPSTAGAVPDAVDRTVP